MAPLKKGNEDEKEKEGEPQAGMDPQAQVDNHVINIDPNPEIEVETEPQARAHQVLIPEIIRSEVNLLCLPFFALSTKGLRSKLKTEYRMTLKQGRKKLSILWQVVANPEHGYPGPFDKEVHKAVEQIISEMEPPIRNPIPLGSFYQLCKRMGIEKVGGMQYRKIKEALERIVATTVKSEGAFYCKSKQEWVEDVFHLYDRVIFKGKKLPNGQIADTNYLFLSSWYLENLNALYVRPIDFKYYRSLKSTVAQRLYELLGVKFYRFLWEDLQCIRYRYSTLCQLLPITRQRFLSKAKEKLEPAHEELRNTDFLEKAEWEGIEGEKDDWFIFYYPGPRAIEELKRHGIPEEAILAGGEGGKYPALQAPRPKLSAVELEGLVEEMVEVLGDEHSRPFYMKVARACPPDVIHRFLSEVKDEWLQGRVKKSKGALFTDKIKRYCQERGIDLKLRASGNT